MKKIISFQIPVELFNKLDRLSKQDSISISAVIRQILNRYFKEHQ